MEPIKNSLRQDTDTPLITVILSTYNWSAVLPYSIQSVLNQTFVDFELLVIGDGCTDDSAQVVGKFKDSRISWINLEKNTGSQSGPNNEGLRRARGKLIAYIGHDDLWANHHLEELVALCQHKKEVFATAAIAWFDEKCTLKHINLLNQLLDRNDRYKGWHFPSGIMHSLSLVNRVGFWSEYSPEQNYYPASEFFSRIQKILPKILSGSLSVVKVPAFSRENIYATRDITPQKFLFEKLQNNPKFLNDIATAFVLASNNQIITVGALYKSFRYLLGNLGLRYVKRRLAALCQNKPPSKNFYRDVRRFKGLE